MRIFLMDRIIQEAGLYVYDNTLVSALHSCEAGAGCSI
jgi:hypothetical protein